MNINSEKDQDGNQHPEEDEWWETPYSIALLKDLSNNRPYAITIDVEEIKYPNVKVRLTLYEYKPNRGKPEMCLLKEQQTFRDSFTVSYFDMPYMDNTRLLEGSRFSIVLKAICTDDLIKEEEYCEQFMSQGEKNLIKKKKKLEDKLNRNNISDDEKNKLKTQISEKQNELIELNAELPKPFPLAVFQVITFKEEFMSLRDRPLFEEMLIKLR